jgi:cob(I)alamin adenosyltransferase
VEEGQQYLAGFQARFFDLRQYVDQGREDAVATTYRLQDELHSLQTSLVSTDPITAQVLQSIATAKQQELDNLEQTITEYDARIANEKEYIINMLQ